MRELQNNLHLGLDPVGFLDDDLGKHDVKIHGVPVLGDRHALPDAVKKHQVRQVIIAMPPARGVEIRDIVRICGEAGVQARIIRGIRITKARSRAKITKRENHEAGAFRLRAS